MSIEDEEKKLAAAREARKVLAESTLRVRAAKREYEAVRAERDCLIFDFLEEFTWYQVQEWTGLVPNTVRQAVERERKRRGLVEE